MNELADLLKSRGACLVGYADLAPVDAHTRQGLPRAVSFCFPLTPQIVIGIREGPTEEYLAEYHRLNALMTEVAAEAAQWLVQHGHRAVGLRASGDGGEHFCAPFQHKTAARLAGLGWIGKTALLVTPEFGPAVRFNTILTDAPLPVAAAPQASACGDCTVCVDLCPGQAASGRIWEEGMPLDAFFAVEKCVFGIRKIAQERNLSGPICGLCVANCPLTRRALQRGESS